jgi:hypothetical protein
MSTTDADLIAEAVLQQYDKLPARRKPRIRDNGVGEWVPLSGIVARQGGTFKCLSLAYDIHYPFSSIGFALDRLAKSKVARA